MVGLFSDVNAAEREEEHAFAPWERLIRRHLRDKPARIARSITIIADSKVRRRVRERERERMRIIYLWTLRSRVLLQPCVALANWRGPTDRETFCPVLWRFFCLVPENARAGERIAYGAQLFIFLVIVPRKSGDWEIFLIGQFNGFAERAVILHIARDVLSFVGIGMVFQKQLKGIRL